MIDVLTNHPVALDSPDHLHPMGTIRDNNKNPRFNQKLFEIFHRQFSLLDLGCAGGGLVRSLLDEGHLAVGLEGSDINKNGHRMEWNYCSGNLFTCDVTKPFQVVRRNSDGIWKNQRFDVVTLWDVFEHFKSEDLPQVLYNIEKHLVEHSAGLLICTVSDEHSPNEWDGTEMHQTIRPQSWWRALFENYGFRDAKYEYDIISPDWIRFVSTAYVMRLSGT